MFDNAKYVVFKLAGDDTEHFIIGLRVHRAG